MMPQNAYDHGKLTYFSLSSSYLLNDDLVPRCPRTSPSQRGRRTSFQRVIYAEARLPTHPSESSRDRQAWLLGSTTLGVMIRELRDVMDASDDNGRIYGLRYRALTSGAQPLRYTLSHILGAPYNAL
jgi:hypothetical protein